MLMPYSMPDNKLIYPMHPDKNYIPQERYTPNMLYS